LVLSIIHTIYRAEDYIFRIRKRSTETSTNAKNARKPFGDQTQKDLEIPLYINDYNHNMNGVDLANQLRQAYEIQRIGYRTWLPLFYWVLNQAVVNAFKLSSLSGAWTGSHLSFREKLYTQLWAYASKLSPAKWREPGPH
jgi:hypothetical protein